MPEHMSTATDRRARLDSYITELSHLAKEQCPDAAVAIRFTQYEDEDAHLVVFLPEGTSETDMDRLGDALTNRSVEILLDTGLLILAGVYEASPQP